ncbi:MAG: ABC transporter substrate-binding protein [Candidatus Caldarchaeum sp.]|nr:ABC transporter substrate-binding protein [Candidatus Caldarchaeum sp.]
MPAKKIQVVLVVVAVVLVASATAFLLLPTVTQPQVRVVKIGLALPLTGPSSVQGRDMLQGAQDLVAEVNRKGGLLGAQIELVTCDDETKAEVGVACIERFATEGIKIVMGTYNSHVALAAMDAAAKHNILYVITVAASDEIPRKIASDLGKYKYVFKTNINASSFELGPHLFIEELLTTGKFKPRNNPPRLALITEDSAWGKYVGTIWKDKFTAKGWTVLQEITPYGSTDYYAILTKIKDFDPDIIKWESSSVAASMALVKQIYEVGLNRRALIFSDNSASQTREFRDAALKVAPNLITYFAYRKEGRDLIIEKGPFYAHQRTSMQFLFKAIEEANSFDVDKVAKAFEKTEFRSIRGLHKFTRYHEQIASPQHIISLMVQVQGGVDVFVWPSDVKERELIVP